MWKTCYFFFVFQVVVTVLVASSALIVALDAYISLREAALQLVPCVNLVRPQRLEPVYSFNNATLICEVRQVLDASLGHFIRLYQQVAGGTADTGL